MEEVSGYNNYKDRYGQLARESVFILSCSLSGRVVHASAELKLRFGTELAGRNLNDFLDDKTVADIIAKSAMGEYCRFNCLLAGRKYSALSEKEGGVITITFYDEDTDIPDAVDENSLKYLQGEINVLLSNLLGALKTFNSEDNPNAMFARKNVYRLLRASRNVFDRMECIRGTINGEKCDHDMLELISAVAEKLRFPLRSINIDLDLWHDGERHICNCVAEHVERMLAIIISCILKCSTTAPEYLRLEIISKEREVLISVLSPGRILSCDMMANALSGFGGAKRTDGELVQSLLTVKALAAYNGGSIIMSAERDGDRIAFLLPGVDDDRAIRFKSQGARYMSGTNTVLVELSEILPDSLY